MAKNQIVWPGQFKLAGRERAGKNARPILNQRLARTAPAGRTKRG